MFDPGGNVIFQPRQLGTGTGYPLGEFIALRQAGGVAFGRQPRAAS